MDTAFLPDDCLLSILNFIQGSTQRNNFSLVSHSCWDLEASSRKRLKINSSFPKHALGPLLARFCSISSLDINYLGWKPSLGPQIGDEALELITTLCPKLESLSLSFCGFITDRGLASLAHCPNLQTLSLNFLPRITSAGLVALSQGCPVLESLHVERCISVSGSDWLEVLGARPTNKNLSSSPSKTTSASCSPLPSSLGTPPSPGLSYSTASTPDSSGSPLLLPLGSPVTPPPLDLPAACPYAPSPFCLAAALRRGVKSQQASSTKAVRKLTVLKCAKVGEQDLARLGKDGWENLEELRFEAAEETSENVGGQLTESATTPSFEDLCEDLNLRNLKVLSLRNCPKAHHEGLALILSRLCTLKKQDKERKETDLSWGLQDLHLINCPGLNDSDMQQLLTSFSGSLRVLSLSLMKWLVHTPVAAASGASAPTPRQEPQTLGIPTTQQNNECRTGTQLGQQQEQEQEQQQQQQAPQLQQSDRAVTTGSLQHVAQVTGLINLELVCRDEFASSARLFQGFADSAISGLVAKLPQLKTLGVGKGLHMMPKTLENLRQKHRGVCISQV